MKTLLTITLAALLLPGASFGAASKEMQELQRDVAQLQEQVRTLQSTVDKQNGTIVELLHQLQESNARTVAALNQLSGTALEKLGSQIQRGLEPMNRVPTEVRNVQNDTTELKAQVSELTVTMNKIMQQLNDVNNSIKVLQAPPAAPPASANTPPPPPPASTLWSNARRDYSGGKMDLALSGFQDFLKYYPTDPMASQAQFFVGQIHYSMVQYDVAAQDFDAVVERYPENEVTSQAQFMKAKSLVQSGKKPEGIKEYKAVVSKYPGSEAAKQATEQLKALGALPAAKAPVKKKR